MIWRTTFALAATAAVLTVFAAPALAGKGGGHGNGTQTTATSAWVNASPGTVASGDLVYLSGCGYDFAPVQVRITHSAGYTQTFLVGMWSTGCMDGAFFTSAEAGTYTIEVFQQTNGKTSWMASTSVIVS